MTGFALCPNLGTCPQRVHPAMLSTSDNGHYVALGATAGALDGQPALMRWEICV